MREIICDQQHENLSLDITNDPLCISLEGNTHEKTIDLKLPQINHFDAVCIHLENANDSFLKPYYTTSYSKIPLSTSIILMRQNNEFIFIICLSYADQNISLSGYSEGIRLHAKSSSLKSEKKAALIILKGTHLHETIERGILLSLKLTGDIGKSIKEKGAFSPWLQRLGWESGSAFKLDCSHDKIIKAISSLLNSGYKIGYVLIDEGWQDTEDSKLKSFEADLLRFPKGLAGLTKELSQLGIKHVGVFHGMMGCREGIHEDLSKQYKLEKDLKGRFFLGKDLGDTFEFFYDY